MRAIKTDLFQYFVAMKYRYIPKNEHEDFNNNFLLFIYLNIGTLKLKNKPYFLTTMTAFMDCSRNFVYL